MKGEKENKYKKLKFKYRVCRRCDKFYLSSTKRGLYCQKCKKKTGAKKKSNSEKGKILDGVSSPLPR